MKRIYQKYYANIPQPIVTRVKVNDDGIVLEQWACILDGEGSFLIKGEPQWAVGKNIANLHDFYYFKTEPEVIEKENVMIEHLRIKYHDEWRESQSINCRMVGQLECRNGMNLTIKIDIHIDASYSFQSSATIRICRDLQWESFDKIPFPFIKTVDRPSRPINPRLEWFEQDINTLIGYTEILRQ